MAFEMDGVFVFSCKHFTTLMALVLNLVLVFLANMAISIGQLGKHGRALGTGKRKRGSRRGVGGRGVSGTGGGGGDGGGRCSCRGVHTKIKHTQRKNTAAAMSTEQKVYNK